METMVAAGDVDVMLTSLSSAENLTRRGIYADAAVTPAVRLNDATDIWSARGGRYKEAPSRHHRTARIDQAKKVADLGLYSVTFSNEARHRPQNAEAYWAFRAEAAAHGMRHFLEVFNPAFDIRLDRQGRDRHISSTTTSSACLAGVTSAQLPAIPQAPIQRPARHGGARLLRPRNLIVGILGGAKGTTRDTFELSRRPRNTAPASPSSAARSTSPRTAARTGRDRCALSSRRT